MFTVVPWHWLVFGLLLIISEMILTTFATLWFGVAAIIVGAIFWIIPISFTTQIILWLVLSILMVVAWFKFIKPLSVDRTKAGLGASSVAGEVGMIIVKPQFEHLGTVRFSVPIAGATEWMCRTHGEEVEVGDKVVVTDIQGNELIVQPVALKGPAPV